MKLSNNELESIKKIELEMLDVFIEICESHNIDYFLAGGTCLGAIRHEGFIPWDDDIDLGMLRSDFNRFEQACQTELPEPFFLQTMFTDPKCGLVFAKIRNTRTEMVENYCKNVDMEQGVWIDIFPYDAVPTDSKIRNAHIRKLNLLKNLYIVKSGYTMPKGKSLPQHIAYYIAKILVAFIPLNQIRDALYKQMTKYNGSSESKFVYPAGGSYGPEKEVKSKEMLNSYCSVLFETRVCKTIERYDDYLTQNYGDYMTLPPKEKRTTVHDIVKIKL